MKNKFINIATQLSNAIENNASTIIVIAGVTFTVVAGVLWYKYTIGQEILEAVIPTEEGLWLIYGEKSTLQAAIESIIMGATGGAIGLFATAVALDVNKAVANKLNRRNNAKK